MYLILDKKGMHSQQGRAKQWKKKKEGRSEEETREVHFGVNEWDEGDCDSAKQKEKWDKIERQRETKKERKYRGRERERERGRG